MKIIAFTDETNFALLIKAQEALKAEGKNEEAEELAIKVLPLFRKKCVEKFGKEYHNLPIEEIFKEYGIEIVWFKKPLVSYKDDDSIEEIIKKSISAIETPTFQEFVDEINSQLFYLRKFTPDTVFPILRRYVFLQKSVRINPSAKPIHYEKKEPEFCKYVLKNGKRCSKRAVMDGFCTRHHPNKKAIPRFMRKSPRYWTRYDRLSCDVYYLKKLSDAKSVQEILQAWSNYQENTEIESLIDEIQIWADNLEDNNLDQTAKYEELQECLEYLEEYYELVDEITSCIDDLTDENIAKIHELIEEIDIDGIDFPSMY
ncbi:MAG: DUF5763 domain-containing protein [Promethearchaeota archaeon]